MACSARAESLISTKANPRDLPVPRFLIRRTRSTMPYRSNNVRMADSVTSKSKLPTKIALPAVIWKTRVYDTGPLSHPAGAARREDAHRRAALSGARARCLCAAKRKGYANSAFHAEPDGPPIPVEDLLRTKIVHWRIFSQPKRGLSGDLYLPTQVNIAAVSNRGVRVLLSVRYAAGFEPKKITGGIVVN
jgi:hypothetical protein